MAVQRGDQVTVTGGRSKGQTGVVFWIGPDKYGSGQRVGITTAAGEKVWAKDTQVRAVDGAGRSEDGAAPKFEYLETEDYDNPCVGAQLRFVDELDEASLRKIGERWITFRRARTHLQCWRFSDTAAEVMIEPKGLDRDALDALESWLRDLHRVVPIASARLFMGSGPPLEGNPAPHPALEAGVLAKLQEADSGARGERIAALEERFAKLGFTLVPVDEHDYASRNPQGAEAWAKRWSKSGKLIGTRSHPAVPIEAAKLDELDLAKKLRPYNKLVPFPNAALLGAVDSKQYLLLLCDERGVRRVFEPSDGLLRDFTWLDQDHVAVLTGARLVLLRVTASGAFAEIASLDVAGANMTLFDHGLMAVRKVDSKRRVSGAVLFVTWDETGFSQLGTLPASSGATLGVDYGTMPLLEIRAKESASPPTLFRLTGKPKRQSKRP